MIEVSKQVLLLLYYISYVTQCKTKMFFKTNYGANPGKKKNDGLNRISAFFSVNKYWVMSEVKCDTYYTLKESVKRLSPNYWSGLPKEPSLIPIIWLH